MFESHYENNSRLFLKYSHIERIFMDYFIFYIYFIISQHTTKYPFTSSVSKNIFKNDSSKNLWFSNYTKKMNFPFILNYYITYVCHTTLNILSIFFHFLLYVSNNSVHFSLFWLQFIKRMLINELILPIISNHFVCVVIPLYSTM